jgi:DNA-binding NarL/FixJ family response regulator
VTTEVRTGAALAEALARLTPDLLVIDAADFPACCFSAFAHIPRQRIIVIGPEPDPSYRRAALDNGAGGWLARDEVAEHLGREMRRVLGCRHDPCPRSGMRAHSPLTTTTATQASRSGRIGH